MGEERGLRSTHPVDLLPPYARDVGSESWRCHCRSRRLAVPMTGPVPHVGNFRNTLALLSIQWPFGLPIPVKHTSFRFVTITVQNRFCARLPEHCKGDMYTEQCCKDSSLAEPGKALTHGVPQSFVSRMLAETRELQNQRSCRGCAAAKLLG